MTYPYPPLKTRADSFSDAIYSTLGSFSDNEEDDNGFNEGNEDEGDEGDDTAGDGARDRDMGDPDAAGGPVRATSSVKPGIHKRPSNLSIPNGNVNGQTGHTAVNRSPQPTSPGSRLHNQQLVVLSLDLSSYRHQTQYLIIASCLMFFSLIYGALQEELVVHIFAGHLPFFLSFVTFAGYGGWAGVVVTLGVKGEDGRGRVGMKLNKLKSIYTSIPTTQFLILAALRSLDLGLTNCAMAYVHYTVKVLLKSSRVIFTMLFATIIMKKRHKRSDYVTVAMMVLGLSIFIYADATTDHTSVFSILGVFMLLGSLVVDGAINNTNEMIMTTNNMPQDELLFAIYTLASVVMFATAVATGELWAGVEFMTSDGPMIEGGAAYSVRMKVGLVFLYVTTGYLGTSLAGAITKHFGALSMSMTSTARKACTLFLSFMIFAKPCTMWHVTGMGLFVGALVLKLSMARRKEKAMLPT